MGSSVGVFEVGGGDTGDVEGRSVTGAAVTGDGVSSMIEFPPGATVKTTVGAGKGVDTVGTGVGSLGGMPPGTALGDALENMLGEALGKTKYDGLSLGLLLGL